MNRIKLYIMPSDQNDFDKILTSKIKKFSSERNLFFSNIYNTNLDKSYEYNIGSNSANNKSAKIKKSDSFLNRTSNLFMKKCKSTKDIFLKCENETPSPPVVKPSKKNTTVVHQNSVYEKTRKPEPMVMVQRSNSNKVSSCYLDEFERNYLYSDNRKNIVKELRKNFENNITMNTNHHQTSPPPQQQQQQQPPQLINQNPKIVRKNSSIYKKCEFSANEIEKSLNNHGNQNIHHHHIEHSMKHSSTNTINNNKVTVHRNKSFYLNERNLNVIECPVARKPPAPVPPPQQIATTKCIQSVITVPVTNHIATATVTATVKKVPAVAVASTQNRKQFYPPIPKLEDLFPHYNTPKANFVCNPKSYTISARLHENKNLYHNYLQEFSGCGDNGPKRSGSVNRIDVDVLKNELDDFVDPKWRSNGCDYGLRTLRRGSRKELDLEQKIDLEIKMREGSAKLLAACNNPKTSNKGTGLNANGSAHSTQILEAAKNLLTSNERMTAYMAELQRRKRDRDTIARAKPTGKISLSEIRMPLMWRDSDHFKNKGDHRRFAVFCLAKIGTEIYDTSLFCPVDRNNTDINFNDVMIFSNINPDFELKLEVYAVMMETDLSIASTPRKIKNTIHSSISRTVGKRLAANLKDELHNTKIGPKFDLIATAHLKLSEASDLPHTHDLTLTPNIAPPSSNNQNPNLNTKLPLFGHFCCRLAVQPDSMEQPAYTGSLQMPQKDQMRSIDGYGRLQSFKLELYDDQKSCDNSIQPRRLIEINRDTKIKLRDETDLVLVNMESGSVEEYLFRTHTAGEATKWYGAIKKTIKEHLQWGHVTMTDPMPLAVPGNSKQFFLRQSRQGSLYDQVPIIENTTQNVNRTNVQDIFTVPNTVSNDTSPTLGGFRTRTSSSSGRSSSQSSSTLSGESLTSINSSSTRRWPFIGK